MNHLRKSFQTPVELVSKAGFEGARSLLNAGLLKSCRTEKSGSLGRFKASEAGDHTCSPQRKLWVAKTENSRAREAGDIISAIRTMVMQASVGGRVVRKSSLQRFLKHVLGVLREIFDENAYQRFLIRTGTEASVRSYRDFQRERESQMSQRPKCC